MIAKELNVEQDMEHNMERTWNNHVSTRLKRHSSRGPSLSR
jgi:hypothetical protein